MDKQDVLGILKDYKTEYALRYGIHDIGVFGSAARDTMTTESDVDVVIRMEKTELFALVGIKEDLEERLKRKVDLVTYRETMNPFLKKRIDGEAVYV